MAMGTFMAAAFTSCAKTAGSAGQPDADLRQLADSIEAIAAEYPGEIGAGVIINDRDTVGIGTGGHYPMMSVFKLHQALALCDDFDRNGISLDSVVTIPQEDLDGHTWSPMLKGHPTGDITLPVRDLLRYSLMQSDNNASNYMFSYLVGIQETDSFVATLIPRESFQIKWSEEKMSADHSKAYDNYTSPIGAAALINRLFTDSILTDESRSFIMSALRECTTGKDRIVAPLLGIEGVTVAHKTGSGYSENGVLAAHNDVAFVALPDGSHYSLAVFVKDIRGDEIMASRAIARISSAVYSFVANQ